MPEVASQTLDFVGRELNVTLAEARTALENYVEQPDNINLLERCTQELHQVQGVLRVLEIYGAALLAEEMEQVASYLLQTASERKSQAESLDALMRAMVQLPSYLERVLAGGRDLALVLLPLLNDLRAVRGSALLSEGTLLLLNLKSDKQAQPVASAPGEPPMTVEQWARRLRARFQVGLIGWIRGERLEQNLDILAAVAQKLEQIATRQPVFQLWWVTGAVIEALQENGLEGGVSVKRLLGLGDREIRRLYEQGEARYAQTPAVELLNNLLYYVGRAESSGPRVQAVRASFRLQELLPVDESIEQERENLSAPSVKLMQTVAVAIREDLSKVKDVLDIFVRRGAGQPKELASQVEMLRKIGDTLGVLGLGELRGNVQVETERLSKMVDGTLPADEATLVQIAATLIGVEDKLDAQLVGLIRPKSAADIEEVEDNDFQQVQAAVLRECILNLARIKEAISQNVGGTLDAAGLDAWQELMRGLKAGLLMLGKARAVEVIEGVTGQLKRVMQPGGQGLPPGFMDRLADAIVSVEYYMETLQAGRSDPWYMLDNAQACVQALEHQQTPILPTLPPVEPSAYAKTLQISPKAVFGAESDPSSTLVGAQTQSHTSTRSKIPPLAETADPELVKLFIEEAHEELAKIKKFFPAWDQNPMEREALVTVRRSFHTLKGSGRMVGARELGEFAWSIENLLNRVLDNTLTRSPQIVEVLRDSVNALPDMIEQLETGRAPRIDPQSIAARANALAAGKPVPAPGAAAAEKTQVITPLPSSAATGMYSNSNVVHMPAAGKAGTAPAGATASGAPTASPTVAPVATPPKGPTFAQSVTGLDARHAQTIVSIHGTQNVADVEQSLLEVPSLDAADSVPSISESFDAHPELDVPELAEAESGPAKSEPTAEDLAADLNNLDLLLPEEASAPAEEAIILEEETPPEEPLIAGVSEAAPIVSEPDPRVAIAGAGIARAADEEDPAAQSGPDDVLRDIYSRETANHVATVRTYLDREEGVSEPHAIPEDVYRACHTLSGSSKMAQARHGIRLAEPLDHWLRRVFNSGLGLLNQDLSLLSDCMLAMEAVVSHLDEVTGYFQNHQVLMDRIAQAEKILDARIAKASEEQAETSVSGEDEEVTEDAGDFDPEVASIFCEEAMELIEVCESALSDWRLEPQSAEYRSALKRPLHTLKGGARMAGITAMGDLSHELETLVMQVDAGFVPADDNMFDVIQASLDELARMRESVANGRRVASARQMIARIHSLTKPKGAAIAAAAPTIKPAAPKGEPYRRSPPAFAQPPAVPPAPQSFAPPPPALTPAEQETPAAEASESPLAAFGETEHSSAEAETRPDSESAFAPEAAHANDLAALSGHVADAHADAGAADTRTDAGATETRAHADAADARAHADAADTGAHADAPDTRANAGAADASSDAEAGAADARAHADAADAGAHADAANAREHAGAADARAHAVAADARANADAADTRSHADAADASSDAEAGALSDYAAARADLGLPESEASPSDLESELRDLESVAAQLRHAEPTGAASDAEPAADEFQLSDSAAEPDADHAEPFAATADPGGDLTADAPTVDQLANAADAGSEPVEEEIRYGDTATVGTLDSDSAFDPSAHGADLPSDAETQLNRALPPHASLPETIEAPIPEFGPSSDFDPQTEAETPPEFDTAATSEPTSGDLAAELLASYSTSEPTSEDEPAVETESGSYDLSGSELADLSAGETADGHVASDYIAARDSAANEEVTPVQSWTPESTQETPTLTEGDSASRGFSSFANEPALSEDQPGTPASHEPSVASFGSSEGSTEDAAESLLGNWANPGSGEPAPIWPPADATPASQEEVSATSEVPYLAPSAPEPTFAPAAHAEQAAPELLHSQPEEPERPTAAALEAAATAAAAATLADTAAAAPAAAQAPSVSTGARSVSVNLARNESKAGEDGLVPPQAVPPGRDPVAPVERQEMARVDAELLDQLLNISGEASIARSRLEQQLGSIDFNLGELSRTVTRLKEQLRNLEIETEAQILHRHEDESTHRGDFDPLELDRYSSIQQFSRALAETANDVGSIQQLLENLGKETQNLLQQQARTITELQNGLMRTRMVPFQRHVQRLSRIVRQAAADTGKKAELVVEGASGELDRQVLERMLPPFEHMLRNAVVHGIEKPIARAAAGKPEAGKIVLELHREGAEVMVRLIDDGAGMNLKAIRDKGAALGLIAPGQTISDEDAMQLILEPGFSTAGTITQQAGRGVGMDVVATEIKRLGGALHMETKPGQGTVFTIRLPFTLAISHALVVRTGDEFYALPLPTVEGVLRLSKAEVLAHLGKDASAFDYGGQKYRFQHLATFVQLEASPLPEQDVTIPVVLVRAGEHSTGLVADELVGSREIVVKSVGPQISSIRGISGATILGDGRIVIILDINALVRAEWRGRAQSTQVAPKDKSDKRVFAMVVDDSITVRRVTQRLLERNGMRVLTARDGMDAVTLLQDNIPDVILLDIEMPRMDGYEVAAHVRNDPRLKDVPIIMITSRVGEKHRARAIELGVDDYLGKPYQEAQLLDAIAPLVERNRAQNSGAFERLGDARV
jgi:chemosensory pili system protein ChpA (sensor histidine kinase/response regulator)